MKILSALKHTLEQYFNVIFAKWYDERAKWNRNRSTREPDGWTTTTKKKIIFTTEMSLLVCYVLTVNMLRCHVAHLAISSARPPVFILTMFFFSSPFTARLFTSLQFTKCELRNVISISDFVVVVVADWIILHDCIQCGSRFRFFLSFFSISFFNFNVKNIAKSYCSTSHIFI